MRIKERTLTSGKLDASNNGRFSIRLFCGKKLISRLLLLVSVTTTFSMLLQLIDESQGSNF